MPISRIRALGIRGARPEIAVGPTQTPVPGRLQESRPPPTALPHPTARTRPEHTASDGGKHDTTLWPHHQESLSSGQGPACKRPAGCCRELLRSSLRSSRKHCSSASYCSVGYSTNRRSATVMWNAGPGGSQAPRHRAWGPSSFSRLTCWKAASSRCTKARQARRFRRLPRR